MSPSAVGHIALMTLMPSVSAVACAAATSWVACAALLACEAEPARRPVPGHATGAVVYATDGRQDWFALDDEPLRAVTRGAAAAMIGWDQVQLGQTTVALQASPALGALYGLCADQRFREQPTAATCSGTLIDTDLVLTAGHCVADLSDCAAHAWVFDYLYEDNGALAPLGADDVYRCVDIVVRPGVDLYDHFDVAVIQLDRPVVGRAPVVIAPGRELAQGTPLILSGFPSGLPLKIDQGGEVRAPRNVYGDYFFGAVDAFHGSSGSGVLAPDLALLGVLVSGADDYVDAGTCSVVQTLDPSDGEEQVTWAHHAVQRLCARGYPSAALCGRSEGRCGDDFCTHGETSASCPGDCRRLFAVPAEWTCDPGWYGAGIGDACHCDCGAPDPDCRRGDARVDHCGAPGATCDARGVCSVSLPAGWRCPFFFYGDGRHCACDCGAPDPDCADPTLPIGGCPTGATCNLDGRCSIEAPATWRCPLKVYAAGDACDCDCGAPDPDCADPARPVLGCVGGSACLEDGGCELPTHQGWVCAPHHYAAADGCDCNCGVHDPDCDGADVILNCGTATSCDPAGRCSDAVEVGPVEDAHAGAEEVEPPPDVAPDVTDGVAIARPDDDATGEGGCSTAAPIAWAWLVLLAAWIRRRAR